MDAEAIPRIPDFALLAKIGQGSYGEVWLAQGVTGVFRAVKVVKRSSFAHERPFEREFQGVTEFAKVAGSEPSQLAILHAGWGLDLSHFYYVMELADDAVSGRVIDPKNYVPLTLAEMAKREGRLSAQKVLELGQALARSLATLHRNALVHRDVKPSNVVIVGGVPKLADIGLVARADEARTFVGTERYAAPEGPGSPKADVFGACKVLGELWAGTEQEGEDSETIPVDLGSESSELAEVLRRGCSLNPADRQKDGQALLEDLLLLQAGKSVKRLRQAERNSKRLKTTLRVGLVVGAIAAVAALGAIQFERLRTREEVAKRKEAEAERDRIAARSLYASEIGQAQRALGTEDLGQARKHLRKAVEGPLASEVQGIEWQLLWKRSQADATEVVRSSGRPSSDLHISPEGRWLAWIEEDSTLLRYDRIAHHLSRVAESVSRVVELEDDGKVTFENSKLELIQSAVGSDSVVILKLQAGESTLQKVPAKGWLIANLKQAGEFYWADGSGGNSERKRWGLPSVFSGTEIFRSQIEVSSDRSRVAIVLLKGVLSDASWSVMVFETSNGALVCDIPFTEVVSSLQFTPDNQALLLRVSSESNLVRVRLSSSELETLTRLPGRCVGKSVLLADGRSAVSVDRRGRILLSEIEAKSWKPVGGGADCIGLCSDVARVSGEIATANEQGEILVWKLREGLERPAIPNVMMPSGGGLFCTFQPHGDKVIAAVSPEGLAHFDLCGRSPLMLNSGTWRPVCVTGQSDLALLADTKGNLRAEEFQQPGMAYWEHRLFESKVWAGVAAQTEDVAVLFSETGDAVSLDVKTGKEIARFHACDGNVLGLCVDPKGSFVYVGDLNGDLSKWSLATGREVGKQLVADTKRVYGLSFISPSPDGRVLVGCPMGSDNRTLLIIDAETLKISRVLSVDTGGVWTAGFSPDGRRLLAGSSRNRLHVYELPDFTELPPLEIAPWLMDSEANETGISNIVIHSGINRVSGITNGGVIWSGGF